MKTDSVIVLKKKLLGYRVRMALAALGRAWRGGLRGVKRVWRFAGYYICLAALLALLGSAAYSYRHRPLPAPRAADKPEAEPVRQEAAVWAPEVLIPPRTPEPTVIPFALTAPVPGEVLTPCSGDAPVWSPTLQQWQLHQAIDFAAEIGEAVCAAEAGEVIGAYSDPLLGNTIELRHANGYVTRYASLNTLTLVEIGQTVEKGQVIASAGDSADAEQELGPHLHFALLIDGRPADPVFEDGE